MMNGLNRRTATPIQVGSELRVDVLIARRYVSGSCQNPIATCLLLELFSERPPCRYFDMHLKGAKR